MGSIYDCCGCRVPMGSQACDTCCSKHSEAKIRTNADKLRNAATKCEIAKLLSEAVRSGVAGGAKDTYHQWLNWLGKEVNSDG